MRYFVESYGCTMNFGEGKQLAYQMESLGHEPASSVDDADIVILNTCTVVDTTEKKMIKRMSELKRSGKKVIITGCMAKVQSNRVSIRLPDSIILPPGRYEELPGLVTEKYGCGSYEKKPTSEKFTILPIAQGCLGNCTYCITKFARGDLFSYPEKDILEDFKKMIAGGAKEILITAQDTACYGRDIGSNLAKLLTEMTAVDGDYRIRIGMMNPNSLKPVLNELIDAMNDPRVYKFLHIPVQSGSDDILHKMKRHYKVEEFKSIIDTLRSKYPDISIATDMIVGFPGETEEDHIKSLDLMKDLKCDTVNITRFSARPGTPAASMEQIHGRIIAERSVEMTKVKNEVEYAVNSKLIGKQYRVLVTEYGKGNTVISRTENYRPIAINEEIQLGTFIDVEVTDCASTYLVGKVI